MAVGRLLNIILLSTVLAPHAFAATLSIPKNHLYWSAAAYTPTPNYTSANSTGQTSLIYPIYGLTGPRAALRLGERWRFEPAARIVLPWRKNIDGNQKIFSAVMQLDGGRYFNNWFELRGGLAFEWLYFKGNASSKSAAGGHTFYTPEVSASTWTSGIDVGFSIALRERWRISADSTWWEPLASDRRKLSVALGVDYALF